ncbi:galactokinase [Bowmanella denitrificans]|uniref:Galactokinase n=1 Tax=Bowmanella denitrificans TaxID=366582 RepID=A0ABN0XP57_9ALTE
MREMQPLLDAFRQHFSNPAAMLFRAPGRVNLMGEHTDYNQGFVLPCALNLYTYVICRPRPGPIITCRALVMPTQPDEFNLDQPILPREQGHWGNYVRGVAAVMRQRGVVLAGCELLIAGTLPQGVGLSSSASLEVALAMAFAAMAGQALTPQDNAGIGQQAENQFAGCQCGIMDQLICAAGVAEHALLLDCRDLAYQPVPIPDGLALMIIESGVKRKLTGSEYNLRRRQCEAAAAHLGKAWLRDVDAVQLVEHRHRLPALLAKRAAHVVSENDRTLSAAKALAEQDISALSQLMAASHRSMAEDFEISVPPIDFLVALLQEIIGEHGGARMTGGGFGGSVVALMPQALLADAEARVMGHYAQQTGLHPRVLLCTAAQGAQRLI